MFRKTSGNDNWKINVLADGRTMETTSSERLFQIRGIAAEKVVSSTAVSRDATTAEMLRGTKVWVPTPGRLPCWVLRAGGGRPLLL